jgi:ubiquinone/menaquinone biosynthesis C-methylase UbiE/uncharacterized protein YbaR (Trm112 family)
MPPTSERHSSSPAADLAIYVCPRCKGSLGVMDDALRCPVCDRTYFVRGEIPDFIIGDLAQSASPILRKVNGIDSLARIYETKLWYPVVLNLSAGWGRISLPQLTSLIREMVASVTGLVLDVACGPGTFGRRIATSSRKVYGIDISTGMLERGIAYAQREQITNMRFARAQVEALPFGHAVFDAAICSGSLHLFQDTVLALREIGRTLKPGARLAIVTFTAGNAGILRFTPVLNLARKKGLRTFEIPELQGILTEAGFNNYRPSTYGSVLICCVQKFDSE